MSFMTSKNDLDIMGIPNLLQSLANTEKTVTLKVQCGMAEKHVYFRKGKIVQVSSPQKPSILAEGLRRHPELDEDSYDAVCQEQRKTGQSLASLLLADEQDGLALVTAICQFQITEEICELFTWEECHCELIEGEPDPMIFDLEIMNIEPVDISMVLLEAARRQDEWKLILKIIPSKKDIPYKIDKKAEELNQEEQILIPAIDGFRDVEDILAIVRLSPFAAMNSLSRLIDKGLITLKNGRELLQIAKLDVFRENFHKRVKLYERALELGEKSREINLWLAHSYEAMGLRDKAGQQYQEIGFISLQNNLYPVSIRAFEKAVQLLPENLNSHEYLVSLLSRMNRMDEYAERMTSFARWLCMAGDRDRAIFLLREATEKFPSNFKNLDLLASLYQECGYRNEAVDIYRNLARLQMEQKDYEGAAQTYQKIVLLDVENMEIRKNLGEIYELLGREKDAINHYRAMGKAIYSAGYFKELKTAEYLILASEKIIAKHPEDLTARQWLSEAYLSRDQIDKGSEQLKEILQRMDEKKDPDLLVATLKHLVQLNPKELEYHFKLGETYLKMKREREAVQEYFAAGVAATEMGQINQALQAFDRLLSFEPSNYATRLKKAEILVQQKNQNKAIEEFMLTGYLSIGGDKLWQAVKAFRQVLTLNRDDVKCYLELAKLYHKLGKKEEAVAAYKKHVQKNVKLNNFGSASDSCDAILRLEPDHQWAKTAQKKILNAIPKFQEAFQN